MTICLMIKSTLPRIRMKSAKPYFICLITECFQEQKKKSKKLLESFHEVAGGLYGMKVMDGREAAKPRAEE